MRGILGILALLCSDLTKNSNEQLKLKKKKKKLTLFKY
jgi:hypothetical protein